MGRKRKAETTFNEDKTSNVCSETTTAILEKHPHSSSAKTTEAVNTGNNVHSNSDFLSPKKTRAKVTDVVVRRSRRLMNSMPRARRLQLNEKISLVQQANTGPILNERATGEEIPHVQPVVIAPILNQRTIEEEIPRVPSVGTVSILNEKNVVDKFEFLAKVFGEFLSKSDKQVYKASNEGSSTDFNYKSLYIGTQKKVENLMEENIHLSQKLEFALRKNEAYEKTMGAICAPKEIVLSPSPSTLKKHVSQSLAAPLAVTGHETSSPEPKKKRTYKKINAVS